jgi:AraC-like DNA-binding protein
VSFAPARYLPPELPRLDLVDVEDEPIRPGPLALLTPLAGRLVVRAGGRSLPLRGGELLIVHRALPLEIARASARARVALFLASPGWVDAFCALHELLPARSAHAAQWFAAPTPVARRATTLLAAPDEASGRLSAAAASALVEIALGAEGSPVGASRTEAERLAQREALLRGLETGVAGIPSLAGLARQLELSRRQTARLVRSETGSSFRELKTAARLQRAQKLLLTSELSILEVALRSGWNSASQFHDAFRRRLGVTPARFRAAHRAP